MHFSPPICLQPVGNKVYNSSVNEFTAPSLIGVSWKGNYEDNGEGFLTGITRARNNTA